MTDVESEIFVHVISACVCVLACVSTVPVARLLVSLFLSYICVYVCVYVCMYVCCNVHVALVALLYVNVCMCKTGIPDQSMYLVRP